MNLAEFCNRLDGDGPDLARWRDEHRAAAERLLAREPAAMRVLDEARRLEGLIARAMQPDAQTASIDRVLGALALPERDGHPADEAGLDLGLRADLGQQARGHRFQLGGILADDCAVVTIKLP